MLKITTLPQRADVELIGLWVVCAAYVIWLLSLPLFPSQDGPMHLYYAHVLGKLLFHPDNSFSRFYVVKHLLPPYALYYYLLLLLSSAMPLLVADRVVICFYVIAFLFGFRYLATAIGPSGGLMALLASTVVLNWPLGMGFVNFCAGLAMAFFGLGLWYRFRGKADNRKRVYFALLCFAMMFTHAVPLLMLLALAVLDLATGWLQARKAAASLIPGTLKADVLTVAVSCLTFLYIKFFTTSHLLQQSGPINRRPYWRWYSNELRAVVKEHGLVMFTGHHADITLTRVCLFLVLLIGLALAGARFVYSCRNGQWTRSETWLCLSVFSLLTLPFVPHEINSSYFFSDRLLLPIWIAPLIAASDWNLRKVTQSSSPVSAEDQTRPLLTSRAASALVTFAVLANISVLVTAERHMRPLAREIKAAIDSAGKYNLEAGQMGMLLDDSLPDEGSNGANWSPFIFAGAHLFRLNDVVLGNPPWAYLKIIPLAATPDLPVYHWSPWLQDHGKDVTKQITVSPTFAKQVLAPTSVVLVREMLNDTTPRVVQMLQQGNGPGGKWSCEHDPSTWYWMCKRGEVLP